MTGTRFDSAADGFGLVEREHELAALDRLVAAARQGAGGGLLLEGAPGIGKSSLIRAARALADGVEVLSARGSELEREFPFVVVRQLLEAPLAAADGKRRSRLLAGVASLAERVLSAPVGDDQLVSEPAGALHGLYWLVANMAAEQPLLITVDDAHWADSPSLRWLAYLAQRLEGLSVALLVAIRPAEATAGVEALDALTLVPQVHVLRPSPLSREAVKRLVEQALAAQADAEFVEACHRVTGGNPFLAGELLRELAVGELAPTGANAAALSRLSSSSVSRAALIRLRRLPPACRELAFAVAVLGDGAELTLAAGVAQLPELVASDAATALAGAVILDDALPLRFAHPLVRESVYVEMGSAQRARWHARAVATLMAADAPADRVAVHLLASEPRGEPSFVETLRMAARDASRRGAPDAACAYLRRAIAEPPPEELAPLVVFELGSAELQAGELQAAAEHLEQAAQRLATASLRALATAHLGGTLLYIGRYEDAVFALNGVISDLPDQEQELGLLLQVLRYSAGQGSRAAWRAAHSQRDRFEVSERASLSPGERVSLAQRALDAAHNQPAEQVRALALRAWGDGELFDNPTPSEPTFFIAPIVLGMTGALELATRIYDQVFEWTRRHGSVYAFSQACHLRSTVGWARGALAEAEADAEQALQYPSFMVRPGVLALVEVHLARGDVDAAARLWREQRMDEEPMTTRASAATLEHRGRLRLALGRTSEALEDFLLCGRMEAEWDIRTPVFSTWRSAAARVLVALDEHDQARRLAAEGLAQGRFYGAPRQLGMTLAAAGIVEGGAKGLELLAEAVNVLANSPARLEHARGLLDFGTALRRVGRRADARARLADAMLLARQCGAEVLAARAHDELLVAGARPRRDPVESRTRLTASELRVARLAANGLSNREIAQALFVTEKTVEVHLTSSYRKLDISSRSQLGRVLQSAR